MTKPLLALVAAGILSIATAISHAAASVTVALDAAHESPHAIPERFAGLSYEMKLVLPDSSADGKDYFSPDNGALLAMFKTLNIRSLRVGGNTADNPAVAYPTPKDIDRLYAFARAADCDVIFTLRLRQTTDATVVDTAKYVMTHYGDRTTCLAIGNEPNVYAKTYDAYKAFLEKYIPMIKAVAPDAKFCGPSTTPGKVAWARSVIGDFAKSGDFALITQHAYPGGSARKVPDPATGRAEMLSPKWLAGYEKFYDAFAPAALAAGVPYRIEECNSFFNGGAKDVSDTQSAALWALDFMYWWASHDCAGLNFHNGDQVAAADNLTPCRYASFTSSPGGYHAHPLAYAFKAFALASKGHIVPVKLSGQGDLNLTAYATKTPDGRTYVTVINKEATADKSATLALPEGHVEYMLLASPDHDAAATEGTTLGGAPITDAGTWSGRWSPLSEKTLELPPATAAIVRLGQ